jgi:dihydrofolate synthase / folylpolyglutamate synthase
MNAPTPSALERLYCLVPRGSNLGLDRVRKAAEALGNVHQIGTYVHIAGTNGKGSTAAMVAAMARAAGAKVGLYTSPHLCKFAERINIDGEQISDEALEESLTKVLAVAEDHELTFFEVATLAALVAFKDAGVNLWVLEVGLGGRLDATNIVEGKAVPVITRIAFDHTQHLGKRLHEIAREKAGILRRDAPCIVGRLHPDARAVVDEVAGQLDCFVHEATSPEESYFVDQHPPALGGMFQRGNAMMAVAVARVLGISPPDIAKGLGTVRWPGRFEVIETNKGYILLDSAHNADGALSLKNSLLALGANFARRQVAVVFGVMEDKNWQPMLDRFTSISAWMIYVEPKGRKAAPPSELNEYAPGEISNSIPEALDLARKHVDRTGLVVVCGSCYLVGEARAFLLNMKCDPFVGMLSNYNSRAVGWCVKLSLRYPEQDTTLATTQHPAQMFLHLSCEFLPPNTEVFWIASQPQTRAFQLR